jgi:hypothetical protein
LNGVRSTILKSRSKNEPYILTQWVNKQLDCANGQFNAISSVVVSALGQHK